MAEIKNIRAEQLEEGGKLNALGSVGVDLLKLLCDNPSAQQSLPAIFEMKDSYLAELDELFKSSGNHTGRRNYLHQVEQTYARSGGISAADSIPGRMLARLYENIQTEIVNRQTPLDMSMRDTLMPIVERYSKMQQRQAGLETLAGNHAQASMLLEECANSTLITKRMLDPDVAPSDSVTLNFELLKSQVLAKDDEAVGTLEVLYMSMLAFAQEHETRFPADFPQSVFIGNLEDAYSEFLDDLENEKTNELLDHPIARLFRSANERGVFDPSPSHD